MILLVDIGNTRIKWATLAAGDFTPGGAVVHRGQDLPQVLARAFSGYRPTRVVVANVAGDDITRRLGAWAEREWGILPSVVETQESALGVCNGYERPEQLGVDRWLALIASRKLCSGPVCVVSCGSAVTIDIIDAAGQHLGGAILPGLALMQKVLVSDTVGIRVGAQAAFETHFGRTTEQCVASGSYNAIAAFIERMVGLARERLGDGMVCVVSGGDAPALASFMSCECRLEPDLVLHGLASIAGNDA